MTLAVRPPSLIPRPETEELVDLVLAAQSDTGRSSQSSESATALRFLEVGCGSGCISIALLRAWPRARGVAIDIAQSGVELTIDNARSHGVLDRLAVRKLAVGHASAPVALADACDGCGAGGGDSGLFDLIVSNPP